MKIALVTDSLVAFGGADRLLLALLKSYSAAEVFTAIFDKQKYTALSDVSVHESFIGHLPFSEYFRKHYTPLSPVAFEQFDFSEFDAVISLSAGCAKGVVTSSKCFHLGIILTPPRNLWGFDPVDKGFFSSAVASYLRMWDQSASLRPDKLVAISEFIKERITRTYRRDADVVYPGLDIKYWCPEPKPRKRDNFYLIVSRLYDYKRIDLAIQACQKMKKRLVIVGTGPEFSRLKSIATDSTEFKGFINDDEVRDYMRSCRGFLFPGVEDFGLAPLEAMACGSPVIAYNYGGVAEIVKDGVTGVKFNEQSVDSLTDAIRRFEKAQVAGAKCVSRASEFSEDNFRREIEQIVEDGIRNKRA